jgi:Mg/Co/Ni transporter MgtE
MSIFKAKWESECAVKVISRSLGTQEVESVVCLFCQAFGRESSDDDCDQKRKQAQKVQSFSAPWRIDTLKKHNKTMHSDEWEEHLQCSTVERKIFFYSALESNTALRCFQEKPITSTEIIVEKKIIETIIEDFLYLADDDEETIFEATKKEKLIEFEPMHNEDDEIQYY